MKCLREADFETLIEASGKVSRNGTNVFYFSFMPIYEDPFLPDSPQNMLKTNRFKHNSNIMIGSLPNEGIYAQLLSGESFTSSKKSSIHSVMNHFKFNDIYSSAIEDAIKFYFTGVDGVDANVAALSLFGDLAIHCPSNIFAYHFSKSNKVFRYVFAYDVPMIFNLSCEHLSPCHCSDLPFFFGTSLTNPSYIEVSDDWIRLNTDFVKGKSDIWPSYYITKNDFVVPFYKDYRGPNYTRSTKVGYRNIQCEFWKSLLIEGEILELLKKIK
ncbi:acetylcholinesterase-like protein [Dinothrombium tinctorium]|uniref:Acetylcholinesterase-like protein n=1 Tax=Dinothrombium tinctorium TaxID=1965070 RepID=A0A3S3NWW7_9ACAR|nr:acetylcholinesterase-like protein [Dinothrombium tinctorium]